MKDKFPHSNCYVCNKFINLSEGHICADSYVSFLKSLREGETDSLGEFYSPIVDAITLQYFNQFEKELCKGSELDTLSFIDELKKKQDPEFRLKKVLEYAPEDKFLFMLVHNNCLENDFCNFQGHYPINLKRINTPMKALDWSFHLKDKTWFNPYGWFEILEDLFGRNPI